MMAAIIALKHFALLIVAVPWCGSLVDIRHRFELPELPIHLKEQILAECKSTFVKFSQPYKHRTMVETTRAGTAVENATETFLHMTGMSPPAGQQCPAAINNCILTKTSPFMEHCEVKCLDISGKLSNDLHCWNDSCFVRATRICEEKFWRTVREKNRKKKKKRMSCMPEIKHCYKLACLKCLGRECNMNCYGGGIQYTHLTKPRWKGYEEYKKFFPEVQKILHQFVLAPEKRVIIEDYEE